MVGPKAHHNAWTVLRPIEPPVLQRMLLYQGKSKYYLLGYNGEETSCNLLTFNHVSSDQLRVHEDPKSYSARDAGALLQKIHELNASEGGLQLVCEAFGLLGCFRFLECYYLLLITKRRPLGDISGHAVYGIADTVLVPLDQPMDTAAEKRYRKMFLSGIDLTRDFFFSYTYNMAFTVQHNLTDTLRSDPFESMFVWNEFLSRDIRNRLDTHQWVLPLVHGCWQQRCLAVLGQMITVTLIARRSRRFAGTRYLKRGINQNGWVANEVETEQVVCLGPYASSLSSVVQLRGSIPLFWGQDALTLNPRPNIVLQNTDPLYEATAKHFTDLHDRYGGPIVVLNLVKSQEKQPRETILRKEFGKAIGFLNDRVFEDDHIVYIPWDFKEHMSKDGRSFLRDIQPVIQTCIASTGLCILSPSYPQSEPRQRTRTLEPQLQQGVLRTNCIDCLDRTNICQYAYGVVALGDQLHALGLLGAEEIDPDCSLAYQLMEMYETMGNVLSWQYGGSEAHATFFDRMRGQSEAATQSRDMVTSLKRYYSNTMTDIEKQHAINLFLGNFIPSPDKPALWDFESDQYLHGSMDLSSLERTNSQGSTLSHTASQVLPLKSCASSTGNSIDMEALDESNVKTGLASAISRFRVPKISQTGNPEKVTPATPDQGSKNKKDSGWRFTSIFKSSRDSKVEFRPPVVQQDTLVSFDEMLSACPIVHVRLHESEGKKSGTFRGLRGLSFHRSFTRIAKQDAMLEFESTGRPQVEGGSWTSESLDVQPSNALQTVGRVSSLTRHAKSSLQALKERSKKLRRRNSGSRRGNSFTGLPHPKLASLNPGLSKFASFPRRAATPPSGAFGYHSHHQRSHSGMTPPPSARAATGARVAFASTPPPLQSNKRFDSGMVARSYSLPGARDIEQLSRDDGSSSLYEDADMGIREIPSEDPVERMWADYWSITPETIASEVAMSAGVSDRLWDVCTDMVGGHWGGDPGSTFSAENCWKDVFSSSLYSGASGLHSPARRGFLYQASKLSGSQRSRGSLGMEEAIEISFTGNGIGLGKEGSHTSESSEMPELPQPRSEGAAPAIPPPSEATLQRRSVTFADSMTTSESARLEKWWGDM